MSQSKEQPVRVLKNRFQQLLESLDNIEPETTDVKQIDELLAMIDEIEQQVEKIKQQ